MGGSDRRLSPGLIRRVRRLRRPGLSRRPRRWRRRSRLELGLLAVTAATLVGVVLRFVSTSWPPAAVAIGMAPALVVFGLIPLVSLATLVRRSPTTAGLLMALAAVAAGLVVPAVNPSRCPGPLDRSGPPVDPELVVLSHNVSWEEGRADLVAAEIETVDPDLVFLQEGGPDFVAEVQSRLDGPYPHMAQAGVGTLSLAILSRHPLSGVADTTGMDELHRNPVLMATVELPEADLRVVNVHLSAPRTPWLAGRWKAEYEDLAVRLDGVDLVAGDFNSTPAHAPFRDLVDDGGFVDARRAAACLPVGTWSPLRWGPGVMQLDHVLVGRGWEPVAARTGGYQASDHRSVIVELRARDRS